MKQRLDIILTERGLAMARNQAKQMIMAGEVTVDGSVALKPGGLVDEGASVEVAERERYVSRAGDKLASVAAAFGLDFDGKTVLDVGSSTGGFTDYALRHGAARAYCVDVGSNQLSPAIRADNRVIVMERTDIRDAVLPQLADMAVMDVSFISSTKVLEAAAALVKPGGRIVVMLKPQFEAGKAIVSKYGAVIPVGAIRDEILAKFREWATERFEIMAEKDSALPGGEGNVERFFLLIAK